MNIDVIAMLQEYAVLPVALLCWIIGYALKNYVSKLPNNYIPLILGLVGVLCVVWINMAVSFDIILSGLCSAALAVWIHQAGKQLAEAKESA
ncbi:MAG: phage holin family protein [Clostridia bacterium]|nr:phage holin family protein [Clostridia bacterium]MBQ8616300.1 phage holin family protein [Clostridia bacterium]